jgi:outer membrane scaffolding protein for murein synthesis (MipA/OmpV family)
MWVGGFLKWDTLHGAAFVNSPLVQKREFWTAGVAVSWILGRSATMVEADH